MSAITGTKCGYVHPDGGKPCARGVKSGKLRCWQHEGMVATGEKKAVISMDEVERQRQLSEEFADMADPKHIKLGNPENFRISMIREFTPIAPDALDAVEKSSKKLGGDMSVPEQARKSLFEKGIDFFVEMLTGEKPQEAYTRPNQGDTEEDHEEEHTPIDKERVSIMQVSGFNRMTAGGKKQHSDEAFHEVVVIDAGTPNEVVVDPYIAMFAPVKDQNKSVDDQLPNGVTPFGDLPWIGPVRSYVGGDYMWWNKFRMENKGKKKR